jgi:hypothetical protein
MRRSRLAVAAAATLGALGLHAGALAQEEAPAEGAPAAEAAPAQPETPPERELLEGVLDTRVQGNVAGSESQERIDTISDETETLLAQYRTALKQIDSLDLYNAQMRDLVAAQDRELASLQDQIDRVQLVGRSMTPLMLLMIDSIEKFVKLDLPFLIEERTKRIDELRKLMARPDVTTAERFRQIMEAYQIENEYGRTIEAYRGTLSLDGAEVTVDFLRFGRIALLYQTLDESQTGMWDPQQKAWVALDSSYRSPVRQGLRIARKQTAPDLVNLPLPAPTDARGES